MITTEERIPEIKDEIFSQQMHALTKSEYTNNRLALPNPALKINGPLFFPMG